MHEVLIWQDGWHHFAFILTTYPIDTFAHKETPSFFSLSKWNIGLEQGIPTFLYNGYIFPFCIQDTIQKIVRRNSV